MGMLRQVYFYKNYFFDFIKMLDPGAVEKIEWTIALLQSLNHIPEKYFKHISGRKGLYELRCEWMGNIYRVFCFFDQGNFVVITSGFQKKDQRTPKKEIEKALRIMNDYFHEKNK
ncbi:MAG: type II toxin-antitoxin system RelE/ParE family toxin [Chitinophagaceae bacterium]|nr:type II toxin-antitoxin system RelE/ParE family toxin [Chitinophagaceae bacterium]